MIIFKNESRTCILSRGLPSKVCGFSGINKPSHTLRRGFSLIEAIMAVVIVGLMLVPLFGLQTNIMNFFMQSVRQFDRLAVANSFAIRARYANQNSSVQRKIEEKNEVLGMTLTYELLPLKNNQFVQVQRLRLERITVSWTLYGISRQETFYRLLFDPKASIPKATA